MQPYVRDRMISKIAEHDDESEDDLEKLSDNALLQRWQDILVAQQPEKRELTKTDHIKLLELQMQLHLGYAAHFNTRMLSGVYKDRVVHKGSHDGPLCNEQELLQDEMGTANTHLHLAQECLDEITRLMNKE